MKTNIRAGIFALTVVAGTAHAVCFGPSFEAKGIVEIVTRPSLCRVYDDAGAMQEALRFADEQCESDGTYNWSKQITAFTITHSCTMGYHPTVATSEAVAQFKCCTAW